MTAAGRRIMEGLKAAIKGDIARVHINGKTWVRYAEVKQLKRQIRAQTKEIGFLHEDIIRLQYTIRQMQKTNANRRPNRKA
jgi:hypothetical protein